MARKGRAVPPVAVRRALIQEQDGRCAYCNSSMVGQELNWDHFVPFSWSLTNRDDNWVLACRPCNTLKYNRHLASEADLTAFCLEVIKSHGSFEEGRPKGFQSLLAAI